MNSMLNRTQKELLNGASNFIDAGFRDARVQPKVKPETPVGIGFKAMNSYAEKTFTVQFFKDLAVKNNREAKDIVKEFISNGFFISEDVRTKILDAPTEAERLLILKNEPIFKGYEALGYKLTDSIKLRVAKGDLSAILEAAPKVLDANVSKLLKDFEPVFASVEARGFTLTENQKIRFVTGDTTALLEGAPVSKTVQLPGNNTASAPAQQPMTVVQQVLANGDAIAQFAKDLTDFYMAHGNASKNGRRIADIIRANAANYPEGVRDRLDEVLAIQLPPDATPQDVQAAVDAFLAKV